MLASRFAALSRLIARDPGSRGIGPISLLSPHALQQTATHLSSLEPNSSVVVITGFSLPPAGLAETDGPLGAVVLAKALLTLRPDVIVSMVTDEKAIGILQAASLVQGLISTSDAQVGCEGHYQFEIFPMFLDCESEDSRIEQSREFAESILDRLRPSHVLAIERVGASHDTHMYSMSGKNVDHLNARTDFLITEASRFGVTMTSCIGDGGNELGFGKFYEGVCEHVNLGETIGCAAAADEVIVCGVSNWGGFGIAAGLYLLQSEKADSKQWEEFVPSNEIHRLTLEKMVEEGAVDGIRLEAIMSVDGMPYDVHQKMSEEMRSICL